MHLIRKEKLRRNAAIRVRAGVWGRRSRNSVCVIIGRDSCSSNTLIRRWVRMVIPSHTINIVSGHLSLCSNICIINSLPSSRALLLTQHDMSIDGHGHGIGWRRCLLQRLGNRLIVVRQQGAVIPFHPSRTGHTTAAIHIRDEIRQQGGQALALQGKELVTAPNDSNGVRLQHDHADERDQHDDAEGLRTQLEQLVPPWELLVLQ